MVPVVLLGAAILFVGWFRLGDQQWRKRWEASQAQVERVRLNAQQGFEAIERLAPTTGTPLAAGSLAPADILQVGPAFDQDGVRYQPVKITEPNGQETEFGYAMLYDRAAWAHASSTQFAGLNGQPVFLESALAHANIEAMVERSARIMCFGFSSSERRFTAAENERLSDDRAINLCEALVRLGYASAQRGQEAIATGFGEARTPVDAATDPSRERPSIIIGIISSPRRPRPQTFLNAVRIATSHAGVAGLDLSNYSRFNQRIQGYVVSNADGHYSGYRDASKWRDAPELYSDAPIAPLASIARQPLR
jgi:hypothetical protein